MLNTEIFLNSYSILITSAVRSIQRLMEDVHKKLIMTFETFLGRIWPKWLLGCQEVYYHYTSKDTK